MPTVPRRPAAQQERERLEARRLRAAELFAAGVRQAEVARQLGISAQAVSVWHRRFKAGGLEACAARARAAPRRGCIRTQRSWLVVERLPAYAPEFNPVEGLWSSLKAVELANLTEPTLAEVIEQAHQGVERVRRTPHLAYSFLRHAGLSVS